MLFTGSVYQFQFNKVQNIIGPELFVQDSYLLLIFQIENHEEALSFCLPTGPDSRTRESQLTEKQSCNTQKSL